MGGPCPGSFYQAGACPIPAEPKQRFGPDWLARLTERYQQHSTVKQQRIADEERRRLEETRRQLVEAQRAAVHEKAKKMGYQVKETREGDTLRLVLIKRTY